MHTAHDLQCLMRDFVLDRLDRDDMAPHLADPPAPPPAPERIAVHRNCTQIGLADALADAFPVVRRLVGDDFFHAMAREFVRAHPPRAASLLFYGAEMPDFLGSWAPAAALPYLPDVARLECSWARAYHAAEAPVLNAAELFGMPEDDLERLVLLPSPGLGLQHSQYPVAAIWRANQPDAEDDAVDLDAGPAFVAICRPHADVDIHDLPEDFFTFLTAAASGLPLGTAWDCAASAHPEFNLPECLAQLLHLGLFKGIDLP